MLKELTLAVSIGVDVQAWLCMLALGQERSSGLPVYPPSLSIHLPTLLATSLPPPPTPPPLGHASHLCPQCTLYLLYCLFISLRPRFFFLPFSFLETFLLPPPPHLVSISFAWVLMYLCMYPSLAAFFHVPLTVYHPITLCLWPVVEQLLFCLFGRLCMLYAVGRGRSRGGREC